MKGIFKNFWLKVFSFILAGILWYHVNTQGRFLPAGLMEKEIKGVPVKILALPGETGMVKISPDKVNIKIRGKKSLFSNLGKEDITIFVKLENLGEGEYQLPLHWRLPEGIHISSISPREVKVEFKFINLPYKD